MVSFRSTIKALSSVLALATVSNAQISTFINRSAAGYSASFNIPASGNDTFIQLNGPASAGWVGTGIGTGMKGALMFVIYSDGNGGVTASARLGLGEFEPEFEESIQYELLDGSGVANGIMTANIRCANCREWNGGSLDVNSTAQNLLWSVGNNEQVATTDKSATIHQHRLYGFYTLNMVAATGGNDTNPFTSNDSIVSTGSSIAAPRTKADRVLIAHGVIMGVTFVLLFPFGAALIRLLNNRVPNALALHRGVQIFNLILAFIGMTMGVWRSSMTGTQWRSYHQVMGIIIVCLLPLQGVLGQMHHRQFLITGTRSAWSYAHIWFGRIVIILGIVNGGIGLGPELANASRGWVITYLVVVAIMAALYALFYLLKERSREVRRQKSIPLKEVM
ncbi:uncharacterized protein H6S33_009876 [Morchella sextelata]|uniref:uncharacterized protein n=1 Tax=Morchella sextelata TaxID=1174677 RepID=UPI001D041AE1|nr:uncharacterized protein H6S33_009876 [Morchella sextelata]KAH0602266.1 hypothetical protein H6S33_009876 [Morchella sextelata]